MTERRDDTTGGEASGGGRGKGRRTVLGGDDGRPPVVILREGPSPPSAWMAGRMDSSTRWISCSFWATVTGPCLPVRKTRNTGHGSRCSA